MSRVLLTASLLIALAACGGGDAPAPPAGPAPLEGSRFAEQDGKKVHYVEKGEGPDTIVLVHGWASDHRVWQKQIGPFSESFRVLAIDLPGHGRSEQPLEAYSMKLFARAIEAVLDHAGVEEAVLVGHSNGVPAVRQFFRIAPMRTRALVLVDGPLRSTFDETSAQGFLARFSGEAYRDDVRQVIDGIPRFGLSAEDHAAIREMALEQPQEAIVGGLKAAVDPEIWGNDWIAVPVLALMTEQQAWAGDYEHYVRLLVPDLDYRVIPGISHFFMMEDAERFNAAVMEWITKE